MYWMDKEKQERQEPILAASTASFGIMIGRSAGEEAAKYEY